MGRASIVEMLINRGARINATNMGDDTALHLAAAHGHRDIVIMVILHIAFCFISSIIVAPKLEFQVLNLCG